MKLSASAVPAAGPVTGPTVILLHGFASSGAADFPAAEWSARLAAAGRPSVTVDLPGHGASVPIVADSFGTAAVLDSLAAVIEAVPTDEVDLVGYSLGGRICWDLARRSPKPVRRAVLGGVSAQEPFGALDAVAARSFFEGGPAPTDPLTGFMTQMMSAPGNDAGSLLALVVGMGREPFDPAASPPQVPTLLLAGAHDPMTQGLEQIAVAVPQGSVERLPGDHLGLLHSAAFRDRVFEFLQVG